MFRTKDVEKIKTHILYSISFFEKKSAVKEMWKNILDPDRSQMTIWNIRIACWLPRATNAQACYVIFTVFPLEQWLSLSVTLCVYWRPFASITPLLFIEEFKKYKMEATSSFILYIQNLIKIHPAVLELQQMDDQTPPALYALILCTRSTLH